MSELSTDIINELVAEREVHARLPETCNLSIAKYIVKDNDHIVNSENPSIKKEYPDKLLHLHQVPTEIVNHVHSFPHYGTKRDCPCVLCSVHITAEISKVPMIVLKPSARRFFKDRKRMAYDVESDEEENITHCNWMGNVSSSEEDKQVAIGSAIALAIKTSEMEYKMREKRKKILSQQL